MDARDEATPSSRSWALDCSLQLSPLRLSLLIFGLTKLLVDDGGVVIEDVDVVEE